METFIENPNLALILDAIYYIALAFLLFFVGKAFYGWFHPNIKVKEELVKKDNLAFSVATIGYFIGLLFAIGSAIVGPSYGLLDDLIIIAVYGLLSILLLNLSSRVNEHVILRKFHVEKEIITDRNPGTGVIEAANYIASGLIIMGAVTGEGKNFFENMIYGYLLSGVITAISFWAIGQAILLLTTLFYDAIVPYKVHDHIEKDNVAVGIGFAGAMVAMANIIRIGITGDFIGWEANVYRLVIDVMIGFALLPIVRFLTDKVLLPGEKLTDEIVNQEKPNIGAAMVEAFAYIGGSVIISWVI
jgi:uncharacterized membrane protein YjfL (UPF0719 family)